MKDQTWDPERYARNARFVAELGRPAVELLAPRAGEQILDLGCGDGALTRELVDCGCEVVGVDASSEQIEAACRLGLDARVMTGEGLTFENEFDAVFSNAALHWMQQPDQVIAGVRRALREGGRFVGEFGGDGCIQKIRDGLAQVLAGWSFDFESLNPWFFPSPEEYGQRLREQGFEVNFIKLIPRPTPLPTGLRGWLETFGERFTSLVPEADRDGFIAEVEELTRADLYQDGEWVADYTRLRFAATRGE